MANFENIKDHSFDKITPKRQREIASMGGKASQAARKKKKNLRELFAMIGDMQVNDKLLADKIKKLGFEQDEITWNLAMAVSTYMTAVKKGDTKTVALILKLLDDSAESKKVNEFDEFMKGED